MALSSLFSPHFAAALTDLQGKFGETRASLIRIRADRARLARTGWRPRIPTETKLIRAAEWTVERAGIALPPTVDFDLESRFVPTESAFTELVERLGEARAEGATPRVFLRGLELDEPRFSISGRPVCSAFFDLVLTLSTHTETVIVLPKIDGYLEARFWADVGRSIESALGIPRNVLRFEVTIETYGGLVEAEEILFELKDFAIGIVYDVRLDHFDALRLESGTPSLPAEDLTKDPWAGAEIPLRTGNLEALAKKRGVRLELRPGGGPPRRTANGHNGSARSTVFSLDSLHAQVSFAFRFLREWFEGNPSPEGKDWVDFELARALLWTSIHSGFLREENYEAWREELGVQPFDAGSANDAAIRTLDPLVRTAIFPDSSMSLAFSVMLEREKTRSVNRLRLA